MGKFKTNKANTKSGSIALVCGIFIIIGIVLIVLPNLTDIADWVSKFGIALIVLATPVIAFIVYDILKRKVKEM
jgi:hypothetical protein